MIGQAKALILALIGIITLLLAGVMGTELPRVRQATAIAETRAVTEDEYRHQTLGTAFRADADAVAFEMRRTYTAELAADLKHQPSVVVAQNTAINRDRG